MAVLDDVRVICLRDGDINAPPRLSESSLADFAIVIDSLIEPRGDCLTRLSRRPSLSR